MDSLRELADTRQVPGEPKRRWFSSPHLDLIVWTRVKTLFLEAAGAVPEVLRQYVSERLDDYPERPR